MASKLFELGLALTAKLDPSLANSFSKAQRTIKSYDSAVNELKTHQYNLDKVMQQRQATLKAAQAYAKAQQTVRALASQMRAAKVPSAELKSAYVAAQVSVQKASVAYQKQKATLQALSASTGMAGKSIRQLKLEEEQLAASVAKATRMQKLQNQISAAQQSRSRFGGQFASGSAQVAATAGMGMALAKVVDPGMQLEKQMSALAATSKLTDAQLQAIQERAVLLGRDTILSADQAAKGIQQFVRAGYDLESSSQAMDAMANLAVITGKDFADASAVSLKALKAFGLDAKDAGQLTDVLAVAMQNSNIDADQMAEKLGAVGPALKQLGLNFSETSAMIVAMDKMNMDSGMLQRTLTALKAPTTAQSKALHEMGLSSLKANGEQKSTIEILSDLSGILNKMPEAERNANLVNVFGSEGFSSAKALLDNMANGTLPNLIKEMNETGSAAKMAGKMQDNLTGDFAGLGSAIAYVAIRAFEALKPVMRTTVQMIANGVTWVGNFAKEHKTLAKWLGVGAAVLGSVVAALGAFNMIIGAGGYVIMTVVAGALKLWKIILLLKNALLVVKGVMLAVNAVMLANPIGLIIAAVAALIAVGVLLYKNWDTVKEKASALWAWFEEKCPWLAGVFSSAFNGIAGTVKTVWDGVKAVFSGIIDFITNVFTGQWGAAWDQITNVFSTVFGGLVGLAKAPINAIISLINKAFAAIGSVSVDIPDWVPGMGGKTLGFEMPQIPMLASGGIVTKPTTAMIGEGAESEAVLPLSKLESMLSGSSGSNASVGSSVINITFAPNITIGVSTDIDPYAQVKRALNEGSNNLRRELERMFADRARLNYS